MLKICHFSDLHASEKNKVEALKALKFIFDQCSERDVQAILNSGDTFDGPITLGENGPANEIVELLSHAPAPLYIIEGTKSHDIPGSLDVFCHLSSHFGISVIREPRSFPMILPSDDKPFSGHISFLPALTKSFLAKDITASPEEMNQLIQEKLQVILADFGAKAADSPKPHILMAHFTVTGSETSTGQVLMGGDIQLSVADLALANADYVALGHIHKAQQQLQLPPHIHYAGSPYHLNFGELEEKGFKIITFDDDGKLVYVEFIKTPSRPRQVIDVRKTQDSWDWSEQPDPDADIRIRVYAPEHEFPSDFEKQIRESYPQCLNIKIEKIPTAEIRIRAAELTAAKTLRAKLLEYAAVKEIEISETVLEKADRLEEEVA